MEDLLGKDGQQLRVGGARQADERKQEKECPDRHEAEGIDEPVAQILQDRRARRQTPIRPDVHHQQARNHRNVAQAVEEEAVGLAGGGDQEAGDHRAQQARTVDHG